MRILTALLPLSVSTVFAEDWPRWMGSDSDGIWKEDGVRKDLPEGGAPVAWRVAVSWGYSGPAVSEGLVYAGLTHQDTIIKAIFVRNDKEIMRVNLGE